KKCPCTDSLRVVHLPDFEQQMAVKSCNLLSKSTFSLGFRDGWQLYAVGATHDSTEVPIAILNTIRTAIGAIGEVESKRVQRVAPRGPGSKEFDERHVKPTRVLITHTLAIEPGMYRLQKPSEMGCKPAEGQGLLADMGVPVLHEVKVQILATHDVPPPA